jgi:hypothetical protein
MKKLISILFITVVVFIGCSPNEDVIQPNDPESMFIKILPNKSLHARFKPSTASKSNNGNGIIFTVDGGFWAIGLNTGIPGVYAFVYDSGFGDVKLFPQENRMEYSFRTNNGNAEVIDFRGDTPELLYTNFCIDKIAIAHFKINTEYWTVVNSEGGIEYWFDLNNNFTPGTVTVDIRINDAFADGECIEPKENKRLKINTNYVYNSNGPNFVNVVARIIDDH